MKITVFIKDGCPYCTKLIDELRTKGVDFQEINISHNRQALKEIKSKYNATRVPVLVEGDKVTVGYLGKLG
ncbi:MAG: glutaredoxin family protein [Bacillota bacterium]|nr:glutaredoxin family protein [Bacillota bacterium]